MPDGSGPSYDVFVSYAHADNEKPLGSAAQYGWVTTLAHNLNTGVGHLPKNLFIDHQLKPGDVFSKDLVTTVGNSTLLLLLLSQNYIDSKWCGKELDHFISTHKNNSDKPVDVFVVELFPIETLSHVPAEILNLRKHRKSAQFWYKPDNPSIPFLAGDPSPQECSLESGRHYWFRLHELRNAIDSRLRSLRRDKLSAPVMAQIEDQPSGTLRRETKEPLGTILLADTTDDLVAHRDAVRARLEPEGIVVLPEGDYVMLTPAEFEAEFARDLEKSHLFVQLLSPTVGRTGRNFSAPLSQLQFDRAVAAKLPIMQWCEHLPEGSEIADPNHARLFDTESLRVTNRTAFENEILAKLRAIIRVENTGCATILEKQVPATTNIHQSILLVRRDPYIGLRSFDERDGGIFFGREQHVRELRAKLEGQQRFIAVLGESGTGKSSLVKAGLVTALHREARATAKPDWNICIFKPGDAPLTNLAKALIELPSWRDSNDRVDAVASLSAALTMSPLTLTELYRQKTQEIAAQPLLLVVDQFEEIFRYRQKNVDEAEAFINLLLRSSSEEAPIHVVMTMRSDFLGNCVAFFGLPESINRGIYLTPRLGPDQLKSIIASPLALVGGVIDPVLVNRLVNTLEGKDELPIMEHALLRMWNRARGNGRNRIENEDFESVCTSHNGQIVQARLTYAIDNHATEIYDALPTEWQPTANQLFLALVERRDSQEVRRPQTVKQLVELVGEQERENLLAVIEIFRTEQVGFLLPPVSTKLIDHTTIDINHESLFRQWHLFRQWLEKEDRDIAELREWQQRAALQQEGGGWLDEYDCERADQWRGRVKCRTSPFGWVRHYGGSVDYNRLNDYIDASLKYVKEIQTEQEHLK